MLDAFTTANPAPGLGQGALDAVAMRTPGRTRCINAENPEQNFRPSCGRITLLHIPGGPWVRFDTALYQDYFVPPYYDSMIGKLIVYAKTREEAIRKLQAALCELVIEGVDHNSQLHMELLSDPEFKSGDYYTDFMAKKGY